jgi:hypothetical protein
MNFLAGIIYYSGKLIFATILFLAVIISVIISLPFIGAGLLKSAMNLEEHHEVNKKALMDFNYYG